MNEDALRRVLWFAGFSFLLYLATVPLTIISQAILVVALLAVLLLFGEAGRFARHEDVQHVMRISIIIVAGFISLRYFYWRSTTTITYHDLPSFIAAIALYLAEAYGITIYLLGAFVNVFPLHRRSPPLPDDPEQLPTVDILIPSYNEDPELLEITLLAATQVAYPRGKFKVYLLDDGGTVQKRNDADPAKAQAAQERHEALQKLAQGCGAHYLTRERNEHAKAGNVNEALQHCDGELVLILDADHVPTSDILQKTVGFFLRDPKLFLVQTPHFFINPDPIERNLDTFESMPGENEMFYTVIQHGLDFWGGSFFCGSAALLRRSCLDEIGGISGETITEDAETALSLHARGYRSVYLGTPLISGLQPETFSGFVLQRVRWAQGMVQIFLLKNPWRLPGLTIPQRLAYTSSSFFWFFPFARVVFILAPIWFLLFGLQIYNANMSEFLAYALPHIVAATMLSNFLYGKTRWPFISELYETMQSLFSFMAITKVFRNPRSPTFNVTPKGERLDGNFISSLATPFYLVITVTLVCLAAAAYRAIHIPEQRSVALITGGWALFNLVLLLGSLGALFERRQRRVTPRVNIAVELGSSLLVEGRVIPCRLFNMSATGTGLFSTIPMAMQPSQGSTVDLVIDNPGLGQLSRIPCRVRRIFTLDDEPRSVWSGIVRRFRRHQVSQVQTVQIGLEFAPVSLSDRRAIVALAFGDSGVLTRNLSRRQRRRNILGALGFLVARGLKHSVNHIGHLIITLWRFIRRPKLAADSV